MKRKKDTRGDLIIGRARMNGFDIKRMTARSGMKLSTMYKRLKLPGTLTVDELASIDKAVRFTDEEILKIVRNK